MSDKPEVGSSAFNSHWRTLTEPTVVRDKDAEAKVRGLWLPAGSPAFERAMRPDKPLPSRDGEEIAERMYREQEAARAQTRARQAALAKVLPTPKGRPGR